MGCAVLGMMKGNAEPECSKTSALLTLATPAGGGLKLRKKLSQHGKGSAGLEAIYCRCARVAHTHRVLAHAGLSVRVARLDRMGSGR